MAVGVAARVARVTLAAMIAATVARAQDVRLAAIRDDATREFVQRYVDAARARGTPPEPLISRALEGAAFKADRGRIEKAMSALEKRLRTAREVLGPQAPVDELAAAADAMAAGVSSGMIADLRKAARQRPITVELGVLTQLVAQDVAPKKAAAMVRELMARGATGAQLTELNAAVRQDVALGITPVAALELRVRGVMSLLPPPASVTAAQKR